jgi:hypothetical protein
MPVNICLVNVAPAIISGHESYVSLTGMLNLISTHRARQVRIFGKCYKIKYLFFIYISAANVDFFCGLQFDTENILTNSAKANIFS